MGEYYVYEWIRLDTNEPFYVGKGKENRCYSLKNRNKHFLNIVGKVDTAIHILEDNLKEDWAFEYEVYYIDEYKNSGYNLTNITDGGEGISQTLEIRRKISDAHLGIRPNENSKYKNRISHLGKGMNAENNKSRKVILLNTLETFECINRARDEYGKKDIQACCQGRKCYAGEINNEKLVWCYYEDYLNMSDEDINIKINKPYGLRKGKNNHKSKRIICITTKMEFDCLLEAGKYYNIKSTSHISSCCQGKRNYCGSLSDGTKLKWMYYDEYIKTNVQPA